MLYFPFPRTLSLYPVALQQALQQGLFQLYDTDYSLAKDPEAWDKMQRDCVTAHAMQMRQHLVAGKTWTENPTGKTDAAKKLSSWVDDALRLHLRCFSAIRYLLSGAVFRGSEYARIYGRRTPCELGGIQGNFWVPTELRHMRKERIRRVVKAGKVELEQWPIVPGEARFWEPVAHPEWLVCHRYNDDESSLGYGRGLAGAVYEYLRAKLAFLQYALAAGARYGPGFLAYAMDTTAAQKGKTAQQVADEALATIRKCAQDGFFAHDVRDKLNVIEGSGTGWQMLSQMLNYLDNGIRTLILGANLPTQATTGGSYAMAEVQENSTEALVQYDREILGETFDASLGAFLLRVNRAELHRVGLDRAPAPRFCLIDEKRADPEKAAQVAATALAAGIPLPRAEVYEKLGYSIPGPETEVISPRMAELEAMPSGSMPGIPGMPGAPPNGKLPADLPVFPSRAAVLASGV